MTTPDDMRRVLAGEPKADEAIFWFCYAWHGGNGTERIPTEFTPDIVRMFGVLERAFPQSLEVPRKRVLYEDLEVGDIIVASDVFLDIPNRWPCKVFRDDGPGRGSLCVMGANGFHRLTPNAEGYVYGFRR